MEDRADRLQGRTPEMGGAPCSGGANRLAVGQSRQWTFSGSLFGCCLVVEGTAWSSWLQRQFQSMFAWTCAASFCPHRPNVGRYSPSHTRLNQVKLESSFSTSTSGKDGKNIKGQPKVKVGKKQAADGTAAMVKAESVLEETPGWPVAGLTFCLFVMFGWDRELEHSPASL